MSAEGIWSADGELSLRRWTPADAETVADALAGAEIRRWTPLQQPQSVAEAHGWIARRLQQAATDQHEHFAVELASTGALVGGVNLFFLDSRRAEIGYFIAGPARGRGLASTAVRLAASWASAHGVERLEALVHPDNGPSRAVAEKAGFQREGLVRSYRLLRGEPQDLLMYARIDADRAERAS